MWKPITTLISAEAQQELKLSLLSQVMDQVKFVHGRKAVNEDTFDWLDDMTIPQLQSKQEEYSQKVKEKADPKLREAKETAKQVEQLKESISVFNSTNDKLVVESLVKKRDELIARYKELTGRYTYP